MSKTDVVDLEGWGLNYRGNPVIEFTPNELAALSVYVAFARSKDMSMGRMQCHADCAAMKIEFALKEIVGK